MKQVQLIFLSVFAGLLLSFPWLGFSPGWILFVAFLPLLIVEEKLFEQRRQKSGIVFFGYAFLAFLTWNLLSTWWIAYAAFWGMIMIVLLNSLIMSTVWWGFHLFKRKIGGRLSGLALISLWLSFEYLHFNWELNWPWLTLGNGFANQVKIIQWYEWTGVLGGSFWILLINWVLFSIYKNVGYSGKSVQGQRVFILLVFIFVPVFISLKVYHSYHESGEKIELVLIQPNVDPYSEKFGGMSAREQVDRLTRLADSLLTDSTDYVLTPETAIPPVWEDEATVADSTIQPFKRLLSQFPNLKIILGAITKKRFSPDEVMPVTARKIDGQGYYVDRYNSAMQIDKSDQVQFYHKSILVNGVEKMPFGRYFSFVEKYIIDLGGTTGSLGEQDEPTVFDSDEGVLVAPVICYESAFGNYLAGFVKKGASFFCIITNDGWWLDSPGYKQHFSFSRLRAIEARRSIARAANTGVSAIINQRGDVFGKTKWWEETVIKGDLFTNEGLTFYVKHGDYLGRISAFIASLLLLYLLVIGTISRNKKNPH